MLIALTFAVLSAICMALMVVTDRLMVGDCYRGNADHAWFVSSLAGSLFGLSLTAILWLWGDQTGLFADTSTLYIHAKSLFLSKGVAAVIVGAIGVQILLHYFRCFEEEAHSSVIAAWLASTPVFVFLGMFVFSLITGVGTSVFNTLWVIGVFLATAGLVVFERLTGGPSGNVGKYRRELVVLVTLNVIYTIALKQVFSIELSGEGNLTEAIALMPFYWVGFAAGTRVMLRKEARDSFRSNWRKRLRYFMVPILFVEVIGMLVFFFEYLSLVRLDPTVVTIILGAHVLIVYGIDLILGWIRDRMEKGGERRTYLLGIRLLKKRLPVPRFNPRMIALEVTVIAIIVGGIALVTVYAG